MKVGRVRCDSVSTGWGSARACSLSRTGLRRRSVCLRDLSPEVEIPRRSSDIFPLLLLGCTLDIVYIRSNVFVVVM